jgi:lipopolysaccharide assembly LptE-like protein
MMVTTRRDFLCSAALVASGMALPACGYSLAGRGSFLPASIKVIGVPMFANNTPIFEIEKRITPRVISEFIGRGKYTVKPDANNVDAVLTGEISSITVTPATFTDERQASKYVITVVTKVEFKDVKADKVLWSNPYLAFREDYEVSNTSSITDPAAFLGQDINALDRLAVELARSIVSAILEAF